jgi:hypothetical protein
MKKLLIASALVVLIVIAFAPMSKVAHAHDNIYVHPYLSEEAAKIYIMINSPEARHISEWLKSGINFIKGGSYDEDETDHIEGLTGVEKTCTHFWSADEGDDAKVKGLVFGVDGVYTNALQKAKLLLNQALEFWKQGDIPNMYERLGHVCHLLEDMGVPAHVHIDFHPPFDDDCFEDWVATDDNYKRWTASDAMAAGGLVNIPSGDFDGNGHIDLYDALYYLMYTTNQYADYFASDDFDGNTYQRLDRQGWIDYTGWGWDNPPTRKAQLVDNDGGDNDNDGDLSKIASRVYVYSIRAVATLYKVFFETLDTTPPTTTLNIGLPKWIDPNGNFYITSETQLSLSADDGPDGSEVNETLYRIYSTSYDTGWSTYTIPFTLSGADGTYTLEYYSLDNAQNKEDTHSQTYVLDNTSPTTVPTIGEPKYISNKPYVTPDTPFTLQATDTGSGVKLTTYRITNSSGYDSGWQIYAQAFNLTSLSDGNYTIAYNSTDNVGNVEATHETNVTLFSWNYVFKDGVRGTILKINTAYKLFQFITPNKDYGIRKATQMGTSILLTISHRDSELILTATAIGRSICTAKATDLKTHKCYCLICIGK